MKLDYNMPLRLKNSVVPIGQRNAYHLAGRIAAIYLGNAQKNLPAVHFQAVIKPSVQENGSAGKQRTISARSQATLEGGRLISDLPPCFQSAIRLLSDNDKRHCQGAFEADVINLLAGSLAEAKYVALRDGEVFNANLIYLGALKFYGGAMELRTIDDYMDCLYPDSERDRKQKLAELFLAAYGFVNKRSNWKAISALAKGLHHLPQSVVSCEELIALLEASNAAEINWPVRHIKEKSVEAANL